jgi:hypothetical protein
MIITEPEVTIGDLGNEKLTKHHHNKPEAMRKQGAINSEPAVPTRNW